jgi:hypothetical protein
LWGGGGRGEKQLEKITWRAVWIKSIRGWRAGNWTQKPIIKFLSKNTEFQIFGAEGLLGAGGGGGGGSGGGKIENV